MFRTIYRQGLVGQVDRNVLFDQTPFQSLELVLI